MGDFKRGDVVIHPEHGRGIVQLGSEGEVLWLEFERHYGVFRVPHLAADLRRLVVIDPEDPEQVERLLSAYYERCDTGGHRGAGAFQAALREFADPKPPKPEEPTGLGAVVEDAEDSKWVRIESRTGWWWRNPAGQNRRWPEIDAVRVLSEGVQP